MKSFALIALLETRGAGGWRRARPAPPATRAAPSSASPPPSTRRANSRCNEMRGNGNVRQISRHAHVYDGAHLSDSLSMLPYVFRWRKCARSSDMASQLDGFEQDSTLMQGRSKCPNRADQRRNPNDPARAPTSVFCVEDVAALRSSCSYISAIQQ